MHEKLTLKWKEVSINIYAELVARVCLGIMSGPSCLNVNLDRCVGHSPL